MEQFLQSFEIEESFWKENPQIKYMSPFAEFYKGDSSKEKSKSSRIMWAIALYSEPTKSRFYRMPPDERVIEINKHYLDNKDDVLKYKPLLDAYPVAIMSVARRNFKAWGDKLFERRKFIDATPYNEKNYKMLDKMMSDTKKMFDEYDSLRQALEEEEVTTVMRGSMRKSAREAKRF